MKSGVLSGLKKPRGFLNRVVRRALGMRPKPPPKYRILVMMPTNLLKSVGPPEGVEYIERERHAVAVHEACHAVMSYLVQRGNVIDTATIQKGRDYLGFVQPIPIE